MNSLQARAIRAADLSLESILQQELLAPRFQPVVDLASGRIYGHESLIRGPHDCPLHMPDALFAAAHRQQLQTQLEWQAFRTGLVQFTETGAHGKIFLNLSGSALCHYWTQWREALPEQLLQGCRIDPTKIVIELTEHDPAKGDLPLLTKALDTLRGHGMRLALDDYGVGHATLQLWAEIRPDLVKIDRYFFKDIARDERRMQLVRAMLAVAQHMNTAVVAEGVECHEDLAAISELGIRYAQGWHLGRPEAQPLPRLPDALEQTMSSLPRAAGRPRASTLGSGRTASALRVQARPVLLSKHSNDDVHRLFQEQRGLHAVAVLDGDNRPVGIINRRDFLEHYSQRYTRDLFGRNSCSTFMNPDPVLIDVATSIDQLSHVLTSDDQRYLADGFIVTSEGRYDGLGTGEALVRSVTEIRLEAARYANPLTSLPGNIPISQHIAHLLEEPGEFVICYADLNNFKPFNDVYGYWRGDDMILLCAEAIKRHCDAQRDFVGHVGGDDFVFAMRSDDWRSRTEAVIAQFNLLALDLYDEQGRSEGGIHAEDRYGVLRFFPFVTLGIGALIVNPSQLAASGVRVRPEDIASAAAQVKHKVKHGDHSLVVENYLRQSWAAERV
ncbi:EAL domain-containing protein [Pseudomonadota bacterium AL_CKDN230030165-1A_HGKHYDSX7]